MKNVNYADMANNLLGDELYYKFITEIAKEGKGENLVDFGKEVVEKCCLLIVSLGILLLSNIFLAIKLISLSFKLLFEWLIISFILSFNSILWVYE